MFKVSHDVNADALYVQLRDEQVQQTTEIGEGTFVDLAADGGLIGIEVLRPARSWPLGDILNKYEVPAHERQLLTVMFGRRDRETLDSRDSTFPAAAELAGAVSAA